MDHSQWWPSQGINGLHSECGALRGLVQGIWVQRERAHHSIYSYGRVLTQFAQAQVAHYALFVPALTLTFSKCLRPV